MTSAHTRTRLAPDERREQILEAAIESFRESDYASVSLDVVADSAGVTRGLLHHYFGSKRALYLEAVERSVRILPTTQLVPDGVDGPLDQVLSACVERWLDLVEAVGGLWNGLEGAGGGGDTDLDLIFTRARDDLVERIIDEVPLPRDLDTTMLRGALRSYAGFARVATDEWLARGTLSRPQTHAMLTETLIAIVSSVVPAMERSTEV